MIVGVAGSGIGCGKTTVLRNITSRFDFIEINLADELKRILMWVNLFSVDFPHMMKLIINNLFRERYSEELHQQIQQCFVRSVVAAIEGSEETAFHTPAFKELFIKKTPYSRIYMQGIGEGFRQFREDVWIDFLLDKAGDHNVIIGDVRYKSEIRRIKERGGIVVYVNRPKPDEQALGLAGDSNSGYIGEKDLADYPFDDFPREAIILNDGDLEHLDNVAQSTLLAMFAKLGVDIQTLEVADV